MKFNITNRLIESITKTHYGKEGLSFLTTVYIYIYIVLKEASAWLHVQIILRRPFPGISFLKIFVMVFLIALQYRPIFVLKEHLIITLTSSLTKKPLFEIFRRVKYCRFLWSQNVRIIPSKPAITLCRISFYFCTVKTVYVTVYCIFTNKKK